MNEYPNWFATMQANFEEWVPTDKPLRVLQIGAYKGDATRWFLDNRDTEFIHDVDTWEGSSTEEVHRNMDFKLVETMYDEQIDNDPRVHKFKMTSNEYFAQNNTTFNFIYIDGDHTAPQVAIDGVYAMKLLEPQGIVAFDDFEWTHENGALFEPQRGIQAVLHIFQDEILEAKLRYQLWVWKK